MVDEIVLEDKMMFGSSTEYPQLFDNIEIDRHRIVSRLTAWLTNDSRPTGSAIVTRREVPICMFQKGNLIFLCTVQTIH
jgi:hypothetical protein